MAAVSTQPEKTSKLARSAGSRWAKMSGKQPESVVEEVTAGDRSVAGLRLIYDDLVGRIQGDRDTSWRIIGLCGLLLPLLSLAFSQLPGEVSAVHHIVLPALLLVCTICFLVSILCGVASVLAFRPLFKSEMSSVASAPGALRVRAKMWCLERLLGEKGMKALQTMTDLTATSRPASLFHTARILERWKGEGGQNGAMSPAFSCGLAPQLWEYCVFLAGLIELRKRPQRWAFYSMLLGFGVCFVALIVVVVALCQMGV